MRFGLLVVVRRSFVCRAGKLRVLPGLGSTLFFDCGVLFSFGLQQPAPPEEVLLGWFVQLHRLSVLPA